jgi:general secretion pathway protein D
MLFYRIGTNAFHHEPITTAAQSLEAASALDSSNVRFHRSMFEVQQPLITDLVTKQPPETFNSHAATPGDKPATVLADEYKLNSQEASASQLLRDTAGQVGVHDSMLWIEMQPDPTFVRLTPRIDRLSFHLEAPASALMRQVLARYSLQPTFVGAETNRVTRLDMTNASYKDAERALALATGDLIVPRSGTNVIVVKDTPENRATYETRQTEVIHLPQMDGDDMAKVLAIIREVFDVTSVTPSQSQRELIVSATPRRLKALNATLQRLFVDPSEVVLDFRSYEIDLTRNMDVGVILPNATTAFNVDTELQSVLTNDASEIQEIVASGLASATDYTAILAILAAAGELTGVLSGSYATFGGGETLTGLMVGNIDANMDLSVSSVRSLDEVQVLCFDQQLEKVLSGTRYPIETATYSFATSTSAGSKALTNESIPEFQYQDLGLSLEVTPRVENDNTITLKLAWKLQALEGTSLNDIPVLTNREYSSTTTLRADETALLVSSASKQDIALITGVPGINEIPGLQEGSNQQTDKQRTRIVITITPRIIHFAHARQAEAAIDLQ